MDRKKRDSKSQKHQVRKQQRNSFKIIIFIAVAMLAVLGYGTSISYAKNQAYIAQEIELMADLEEEMQRTEEIEEFKEYAQTDEYVEQIAKEKLNMAYPEEVIFVPMD